MPPAALHPTAGILFSWFVSLLVSLFNTDPLLEMEIMTIVLLRCGCRKEQESK